MPKRTDRKAERQHQYFRVIVTFSDGETAGHRIFKDQAKAERWAERQRKSAVVKEASLEPFVREVYQRHRRRTAKNKRAQPEQ